MWLVEKLKGLSLTTLWTKFQGLIVPHALSVLAMHQLPILEDCEGAQQITGWEANPAAIATHDAVMEDCGIWALCVVSISEYVQKHKVLKFKKKHDLATTAHTAAGDIKMGDPDSRTVPLASLVKKLVNKAVTATLKSAIPDACKHTAPKGKGKGGADKKGKGKCNLMGQAKVGPTHSSPRKANLVLGKLHKGNCQAPGCPPQVCPLAIQKALISQFAQIQNEETTSRSGSKVMSSSTYSQATMQKGQWRTKGKGKQMPKGILDTWQNVILDGNSVCGGTSITGGSTCLVKHMPCKNYVNSFKSITPDHASLSQPGCFIKEGDLWISNPSSILDQFLELSLPKAIDEIVSRMSLEMISSLRYQ